MVSISKLVRVRIHYSLPKPRNAINWQGQWLTTSVRAAAACTVGIFIIFCSVNCKYRTIQRNYPQRWTPHQRKWRSASSHQLTAHKMRICLQKSSTQKRFFLQNPSTKGVSPLDFINKKGFHFQISSACRLRQQYRYNFSGLYGTS